MYTYIYIYIIYHIIYPHIYIYIYICLRFSLPPRLPGTLQASDQAAALSCHVLGSHLAIPHTIWKMMEFVSWDDDISQYMNNPNVPKHQPDIHSDILIFMASSLTFYSGIPIFYLAFSLFGSRPSPQSLELAIWGSGPGAAQSVQSSEKTWSTPDISRCFSQKTWNTLDISGSLSGKTWNVLDFSRKKKWNILDVDQKKNLEHPNIPMQLALRHVTNVSMDWGNWLHWPCKNWSTVIVIWLRMWRWGAHGLIGSEKPTKTMAIIPSVYGACFLV